MQHPSSATSSASGFRAAARAAGARALGRQRGAVSAVRTAPPSEPSGLPHACTHACMLWPPAQAAPRSTSPNGRGRARCSGQHCGALQDGSGAVASSQRRVFGTQCRRDRLPRSSLGDGPGDGPDALALQRQGERGMSSAHPRHPTACLLGAVSHRHARASHGRRTWGKTLEADRLSQARWGARGAGICSSTSSSAMSVRV